MEEAPALTLPKEINQTLETCSPKEILQWGFDVFGNDIAIGTGFGLSGVVLSYLGAQVCPDATFFYLDTHLLFPESHALRRRLERLLGIEFERVTAESVLPDCETRPLPQQWTFDHDGCCFSRKVAPLRKFLYGRGLWVTGVRRDQAHTREGLPIVVWDPRCKTYKIHPLAVWTSEQVREFIREHDLPYNELHDKGYPSVGCIPCTRPVRNGEDQRAGRWAGTKKTECGIHTPMDHLYSPD